ncbi:alpha 1,2-mannosyltransferase 2.4.1 [Xylographa soralifera]|nr:alpha 1,2-mannosyltransferase 2.4.1 [Xylographa soralifera]
MSAFGPNIGSNRKQGVLIAILYEFPRPDFFPPVTYNDFSASWGQRGHNEIAGNDSRQTNATFVTLTRNSDLWELVKSIRSVEDRFNRHHGYDWVFLNDVPFDEEFKNVTSSLTSGNTYYGLVPKEHWSYPDWIDQRQAAQTRRETATQYMYGGSESYRHMCRFFSGFFFRHELLEKYEYYWRVEPETELFCDIDFDPFRFMKDNGKKYGFVISQREFEVTIPSLWNTVKSFVKTHPEHVAQGNSLGFISDDDGETYNGCHFWSNFEIGSLDWLRSQQYLDFFNFLDKQGGFFYERWGDAPVHSIAASLMLKKEEVHFFNEIAYYHPPFMHCPTGEPLKRELKCHCNQRRNFDWMEWSCLPRFFELHQLPKPSGYEEELPLIAEEADRIVENDKIAQADDIAEAERMIEEQRVAEKAKLSGNQRAMLGKAKPSEADFKVLRAENAAWKRIVSYMMQRQRNPLRRSSQKERWRPRTK